MYQDIPLLQTLRNPSHDTNDVKAEINELGDVISRFGDETFDQGDHIALDALLAMRSTETLAQMTINAQGWYNYSSKFLPNSSRKAKHIVDKMLLNYLNVGFIHLMFPNALIIHMVRDPLDTLVSCFRTSFGHPNLRWTQSIDSLYNGYRIYLEVMAHFRKHLPGRIYEVQYEQLIRQPEIVLRGILDQLDLPWDPFILSYHKINRTVHTSSTLQVKRKLYSSSVGAWKHYAMHLKQLAGKLRQVIDYLERQEGGDAMPFKDTINWKLDIDFEYPV